MGRTVEGRVVIEMTAEARAAIETTDVARAKMIGMIAEPRMIKMTVVRRKLTDEGIGTEAGPRKVIEIGGVRKMTSEGIGIEAEVRGMIETTVAVMARKRTGRTAALI